MAQQLSDSYEYVIVGGGVAADKAARAISAESGGGGILVVSADPDGPVYRPDLSKDLWQKSGAEADPAGSLLGTGEVDGVELALDATATALDPDAHTVTIAAGGEEKVVSFGKLLLATGASPNKPAELDDPRVVYLRSTDDYRRLRSLAHDGVRAIVAGGGYIGSEIAAALVANGARTTMVYREAKLLSQMFSSSIVERVEESFRSGGVELRPAFEIGEIVAGNEQVSVVSASGEAVDGDLVVVGFGVHPNIDLAEAAGLTVDGGVVVDSELRTSAPDVYAAGDLVVFEDPLFGRRRVEHVDHAEHSGETAGKNMAGASENYDYTPMFWSDLFDDGYEAVGSLDGHAETIETWDDDGSAAVVWYLRDASPIGVLLWNTWDSVGKAKQAIADVKAGKLAVDDLRTVIEPG
ncbi:NAD(P)/FAD-dependent oxidoreductase [Dietzia timorensis]|uniref:Putative apoptosis-inducing factor 1, mitochondria l n=1 Tax=Dietzia timorensis TaxID=499555 RepID=A0A173LJA6_9ACTN|nr:FAD/NAD(P)-binding oxidoreductase [Dietzia timorensis]ANI91714.1 Putative apoptosis-inducing factor 1, mitochondria l [Dietzia timorensis]